MRLPLNRWGSLLEALGRFRRNRHSRRAAAARRRSTVRRHSFDHLEQRVVLNAAPITADDVYTAYVGEQVQFSEDQLLANDHDPDAGDVMSIVGLRGRPQHGSLTWDYTGDFTYTPQADFHGQDSFEYVVTDNHGNESRGRVMIRLNSAPELNPNEYAPEWDGIDEDNYNSAGMQVGDWLDAAAGYGYVTDADGDPLGMAVTGLNPDGDDEATGRWEFRLAGASNWTSIDDADDTTPVLLAADVYLRYVPDADSSGKTSLAFRAWDGSDGAINAVPPDTSTDNGGSSAYSESVGRLVLYVTEVNDDPTTAPTNDVIEVVDEVRLDNASLLSHIGAADVDDAELTASFDVPQYGLYGTLTWDAVTAEYVYTSNQTTGGDDVFTLMIFDPRGGSTTTDVTFRALYVPPVVTVTVDPGSTVEDDSTPATFVFTRSGGDLSQSLTVNYSRSGTADDEDFNSSEFTGSVTFDPYVEEVRLDLYAAIDNEVEGDETVVIGLDSSDDYEIGSDAEAEAVITDDPPVVTVSVDPGSTMEGDSTAATFVFTRTGGDLSQELTVSYSLSGSADASDYDQSEFTGFVTFEANVDEVRLDVFATIDNEVEGDETVVVTLDDGDAAEAVITDDPPVVTVTVDPGSTLEGDWAPATFVFTRTGGDLSQELTVGYTLSGSADENDYDQSAFNGFITFDANVEEVRLDVSAVLDNEVEGDETVVVTLDDGGAAEAVITDDPSAVTVTVDSGSTLEGDWAPATFVFTRTGGDLSQELTVGYTLSGSADEYDYDQSGLTGFVTFDANVDEVRLDVFASVDNEVEGDETVVLTLDDGGEAEAVITDDPPVVTVTVDPASTLEGDWNAATFVFTRTGGDLSQELTAGYTLSGSADESDYDQSEFTGTVYFGPGVEEVRLDVMASIDNEIEGDETVVVTLDDGGEAEVVITDDPPVVTVSVDPGSTVEGDSTAATFVFTRTGGDLSQELTVGYSLDGSADENDYDQSEFTGTIYFAPGLEEVRLDVVASIDNEVEGEETVVVTLDDGGAAEVVITDDPPVVTVSVDPGAAIEGSADGAMIVFTRSGGDLSQELTVGYSLSGSAGENDYNRSDFTGSVYFGPGVDEVQLEVFASIDNDVEGDETVIVGLDESTEYEIGGDAEVVITDDPPVVTVTVDPGSTIEDDSTPATFVFVRTGGDMSQELTVGYTLSGSADENDFNAFEFTREVYFAPGVDEVRIDLFAAIDNESEGDETVVVGLDSSADYEIGAEAEAEAVITDDPPVVTVTVDPGSTLEGDLTAATFTFTRTGGDLSQELTVGYSLSGSADENDYDQSAFTGFVTFDANADEVRLDVFATIDNEIDGDETVVVTLDDGGEAEAMITDAPPVVTVTVDPGSTLEGDWVAATFTFTRTGGDLSQELTVGYTLSGSASDDDYNRSDFTGSVYFGPGVDVVSLDVSAVIDNEVEGDETVVVTLDDGGEAEAVITDDPPMVTVTVDPGSTLEGDWIPATFVFTRTGGDLSQELTVGYTLSGSADENDYDQSAFTGFITFDANVDEVRLDVYASIDNEVEGDETVVVTLDDGGTAEVTITDATVPLPVVTISADPSDTTEGDTQAPARFIVTRTGDTSSDLTVYYSIGPSSTVDDVDYNASAFATGSVVIENGYDSAVIDLLAALDNELEGDEFLVLQLETGDYEIGTDDEATVTIIDATLPPPAITLAADPGEINEGELITLVVTIENPPTIPFDYTLDWGDGATSTGQLAAGTDYAEFTHIYADDGGSPGNGTPSDQYAVTFTIDDGAHDPVDAETSITVNNVAPTITLDDTDITVNEGDTFTISGTVGDAAPGDVLTVSFTWNGTLYSQGGLHAGEQFSFDLTAEDDVTEEIAVSIADDDGGSSTETVEVVVNNLNPTISLESSSIEVNEGGTFTISGTVSDAGADDELTVSLIWRGETYTSEPLSPGESFSFTLDAGDDNPSNTAADDYDIDVTVSDDDGGSASATASVTVNNVAPTITVDQPASGTYDEAPSGGITISGTVDDPADQTITVKLLVDGMVYASQQITAGGAFSFSFAFDDDDLNASDDSDDGGSVDVEFEIVATDDDTGETSESGGSATIQNVDPSDPVGGDLGEFDCDALPSADDIKAGADAYDPGSDILHKEIVSEEVIEYWWDDFGYDETGYYYEKFLAVVQLWDDDGSERVDAEVNYIVRHPIEWVLVSSEMIDEYEGEEYYEVILNAEDDEYELDEDGKVVNAGSLLDNDSTTVIRHTPYYEDWEDNWQLVGVCDHVGMLDEHFDTYTIDTGESEDLGDVAELSIVGDEPPVFGKTHPVWRVNADGTFVYEQDIEQYDGPLDDGFTATVTAEYEGTTVILATFTLLQAPARPTLVAPPDQTHREGSSPTLQIQVNNAAGGETFEATGLPDGLTIDSATGLISGKIKYQAYDNQPAGGYTVTLTLKRASGAVADTKTFKWTVTDAKIDQLVGTEMHGASPTSNSVTAVDRSGTKIYVSENGSGSYNQLRISVGGADLPDDRSDVLWAYADQRGDFVNPTTLTFSDLQEAFHILVGIDLNGNHWLDENEQTISITFDRLDLAGTEFRSKRIAGGPEETGAYTVKSGELFEVGGDFEFQMLATTGRLGAPSLLRWETWSDGPLWNNTRLDGGQGTMIENGMTISRLFVTGDIGYTWVRLYADANDNGQWDSEEGYADSAVFQIVPKKVYTYNIRISDQITDSDEAVIAKISSQLTSGTNRLLRKDNENDWRGAIQVNIGAVTRYPATLRQTSIGGAVTMGEILSKAEADALLDGAPDNTITVVHSMFDPVDVVVHGYAGGTDSKIAFSYADPGPDTTLVHEIGHNAGNGHTSTSIPDYQNYIMVDSFYTDLPGNMATQGEAENWSGI